MRALRLLLLLLAIPAAQAEPPPAAQCLAAIAAAERLHGTPPGLLLAIARVESGRPVPPSGEVQPWPWAINVDGQDSFFATKPEAIAFVVQSLARGARFVDVGCMQVDLQMHPARSEERRVGNACRLR